MSELGENCVQGLFYSPGNAVVFLGGGKSTANDLLCCVYIQPLWIALFLSAAEHPAHHTVTQYTGMLSRVER